MTLLDIFFRWRRDRREARREVRDEQAGQRDIRRELFDVLKIAMDSAPTAENRSAAQHKLFQAAMGWAGALEESALPYALNGEPIEVTGRVLRDRALAEGSLRSQILNLAKHAHQLGEHVMAISLAEVADDVEVSANPNDALLKASLLEEVGRIDDALSVLDAVDQPPTARRLALKSKAVILSNLGRTHEASLVVEQLITERRDAIGLATQAWVQRAAQQDVAAMASIKSALDQLPDDPDLLHIGLSYALEDKLDHDASELSFRLLDVEPDNELALRASVELYVRAGDGPAAVTQAEKLVEASKGTKGSHGVLAWALGTKGDHEGALKELDVAIDLDPGDSELRFQRVKELLLVPQPFFASEDDRFRSVISTLSAVIENPSSRSGLKASALAMRAVLLLFQGARIIANLDFKEAMASGLPEGVEDVMIRELQNITKIARSGKRSQN